MRSIVEGGRVLSIHAGPRPRAVMAAVPAVVLCVLLVLAWTPSPTPAQDLPAGLAVTVVPANDAGAPRPTGSIHVSVNDGNLATIPLVPGTEPLTAVTPLTAGALTALGQTVTITYSGDSNYEASDGVTVTSPTRDGLTITAQPRDGEAPSIEIGSPGDGVQYEVGESLLAIYDCKDPGGRSPVTTCRGPVAAGAAIDTSRAGAFSFEVSSADALGNTATKAVTFRVVLELGATSPPAPPPATSGSSGDSPPPPAQPATPAAGGPPDGPAAPAAGEPAAAEPATPSETAPAQPRPSAAEPSSGEGGTDSANAPAGPGDPGATPAEGKPYDPRSEPAKVVGTFVAGFALLQLGAGGGGLAMAGRRGGGAARGRRRQPGSGGGQESSTERDSVDYEALDIQYIGGVAAVAAGDRSRSWRWPGTRAVDALAVNLAARLAPRSPLLTRLVTDGTAMRAIFGSASQLVPLAGLVLGILALRDTGGEVAPPDATLTIAIAAIAVIDAGAGMVAVLTFLIGVLAYGGLSSNNDLRLLLGLTALWCVVPVVAGAARPLRRVAARGAEETWDRLADFVIAGLVGAWAVQQIVLALPGLAGRELPIADHANAAAYCVLAALVVRLGIETIAAHLYPLRVTVAHPEELPDPPAPQRFAAIAFRTAIFLFLAHVVVGSSWQLYVGTALFVIPQILSIYEDRLPNSPSLYRVLPKGLVELVFMLLVGTSVGALLLSVMNEKAEDFLATTFVLLLLPGFVLSLVQLFGRDGREPRIGWRKRFAGLGLVVLGVLLALGLVF